MSFLKSDKSNSVSESNIWLLLNRYVPTSFRSTCQLRENERQGSHILWKEGPLLQWWLITPENQLTHPDTPETTAWFMALPMESGFSAPAINNELALY